MKGKEVLIYKRLIPKFKGTIAPLRSSKHIPTLTWVQESNGRHLVKVDVTPQEEILQEEIPQEEISPEEMATPIDDALVQKICKVLEDQGEVLKKMGSRLIKLEESKIKKLVHVEINEEEEKEDWDERDKTNYERKK
ncbi:hypothetical protein SO802_017588 [Lithocarpus litseifolius]|uniref:Uncharacterized protein n=1 Tax=Lithocarpus litseifolius TaxID=425828 RepID=A0AAW2CIE7_9ROSI